MKTVSPNESKEEKNYIVTKCDLKRLSSGHCQVTGIFVVHL